MSRTLIGLVSYGNLRFTEMAIRSIQETATLPVDIFVVIAKPGDDESKQWVMARGFNFSAHSQNNGFPSSLNDIYDFAWPGLAAPETHWKRHPDYDHLIIMGNDVIAYPGAIDSMIKAADETDWEIICASQFDSKSLVARYPEARKYFEGPNLNFSDFGARPWEMHNDIPAAEIEPHSLKDVRNMTLFKRSVHEKIGYADANFWPGGYFEDNDYCARAIRAGIKPCGLKHAAFFHFWSRTIHQEGGSTTNVHFDKNQAFYQMKWGGDFGQELFNLPFKGQPYSFVPGINLPGALKIHSRENERQIIDYWRSQ